MKINNFAIFVLIVAVLAVNLAYARHPPKTTTTTSIPKTTSTISTTTIPSNVPVQGGKIFTNPLTSFFKMIHFG